jgi:hypothetical protein
MMDKPGRAVPRFPFFKSTPAGIAIRLRLQHILGSMVRETARGIAAAACGGDILFHEACRDLEVPSELYLALPVNEFDKASVAFGGEDWEVRYFDLVRTLPVHILFPEAKTDAGPEIWERANEWMLKSALKNGGAEMTLLALWDGNIGETGGTHHMIKVARENGAGVEIIDIKGI